MLRGKSVVYCTDRIAASSFSDVFDDHEHEQAPEAESSLGWFHVHFIASEPVKTIPRRRVMSYDLFRARFVKFGGR
jgi:hypothetical protein